MKKHRVQRETEAQLNSEMFYFENSLDGIFPFNVSNSFLKKKESESVSKFHFENVLLHFCQ